MEKIFFEKRETVEFLIIMAFIIIGAFFRLIPHPDNFSPVLAMALFGGVYLSKKFSLIIPLGILVISDIFIGFYEPILMLFVYGSFLICVFLGFWLRKNKKIFYIFGISLTGSLLFFLLTNFSVWAFMPWYPKTVAGFIQCYLMALPFFKNTLLGDMFYVGFFFGAYETIGILLKKRFRIKKENLITSK